MTFNTQNETCLQMPGGYEIRRAVSADIEAIVSLDRENMKPHVERHYPGLWNEENATTIVRDNLERAKVVVLEGRVVAACYWWSEEPLTAVLHSVQVCPEHQGKGIGTWLVKDFEAEARAFGLERAGLAVFKDNPAQRLYERLGYVVSGTDGPHALEMTKRI